MKDPDKKPRCPAKATEAYRALNHRIKARKPAAESKKRDHARHYSTGKGLPPWMFGNGLPEDPDE